MAPTVAAASARSLGTEKRGMIVEDEGTYVVEAQDPSSPEEGGEGSVKTRADGQLALKTASDGKTILIPQPSDSKDDPLNWSWRKKHCVMIALASGALLTDWGMTWGTTLFEAQAADWHMSLPAVANSVSGGIFLQGPGGVLAVPLVQRYGRLPVLFWSQFLSCVVVIGAALSPTYAGFTACRTLQGFFNTAPQVIGLSMIHDMFFFHERTRKVNIWAFSFLCGPFLGPMFSGLLLERVSWRADFGILAALYGCSTLIVVVFGDETLYDRDGEADGGQKQARGPKWQRLIGIEGMRTHGRPGLWTVMVHLLKIAILPYLFLPTAIFICIIFMWGIGIVTTVTQFVKPPPYLFSDQAVALLFLAPFLGALVAEVWGHFFNDWLCRSYIRRHHGLYKPENRLWGTYPAAIITVAALILYGQTLHHQLSWLGLAFGWGGVAFGFLAATTAVSAYVLDCFPRYAALASSWINFWRTTGGFCVSYFQLQWVKRSGPAVSFGCQAAIVVAAFGAIVATQLFGARWRARYPIPVAERVQG